MARPQKAKERVANLRDTFKKNPGKVYTPHQVHKDIVGAAYWRGALKELKEEGMNIEAVRKGRAVIGYKYVGQGKATAKPAKVDVVKAVKKADAKVVKLSEAKAKKDTLAKKAAKPAVVKQEKKAASKPKKATPATKKAGKEVDVVKAVEEMEVTADEDPDVLAILKQAGLPTE